MSFVFDASLESDEGFVQQHNHAIIFSLDFLHILVVPLLSK
jgi:hypothetical protein